MASGNLSSSSHSRKLSSGSNAAASAPAADTSSASLLSSSTSSSNGNATTTASSTSGLNKRNRMKSTTPSAINTAAANALLNTSTSSSSNGSGLGIGSSTTPTSSSKQLPSSSSGSSNANNATLTQTLSGLLSPDSASNLSAAQQSALAKALAAGISREDFEKTRASVVSMLRGRNGSTSAGSTANGERELLSASTSSRRSVTPVPFSASNSADNSLVVIDEFMEGISTREEGGRSHDTLPRLAIAEDAISQQQQQQQQQPSLANSIASSSQSTTSTTNKANRTNSQSGPRGGLDSASTSQTNLSSIFSEPVSNVPSTSASASASASTSTLTLRTSVSSSATDDVYAQDSPLTSEDGIAAVHDDQEDGKHGQNNGNDIDLDVDVDELEDEHELVSPVLSEQAAATPATTAKSVTAASPHSRTSSGGGGGGNQSHSTQPKTLSTTAKATAARQRRKLQKEKLAAAAVKEADNVRAPQEQQERQHQHHQRQLTPTMQLDNNKSSGGRRSKAAKRVSNIVTEGNEATKVEIDELDLDINDTPLSAISMDRSHTSIGLDEEDDSSFSAATAAAAALGMLASSPIKIVERKSTTTGGGVGQSYTHGQGQGHIRGGQGHESVSAMPSLSNGPIVPFMNGASGMFSQHRQPSSSFVSSSSPPIRGGGHGVPSSSSSTTLVGGLYSTSPPIRGSHSPLLHGHLEFDEEDDEDGQNYHHHHSSPRRRRRASIGRRRSPSNGNVADHLGGNRKQHSTTPVRTRLEDIALKSSAQIRRQRELLGLGEEEMMDMDTDARHENILLRDGSVFVGEEDEDEAKGERRLRKVKVEDEPFLDYEEDDEEEEQDHRRVDQRAGHGEGRGGKQVYASSSAAAAAARGSGKGRHISDSNRTGMRLNQRPPPSGYDRPEEEDGDDADDIDIDIDVQLELENSGGSSGGLAPAFSYPRTSSPAPSSSHAAAAIRRLSSRSPSRYVPSSEPRPSSHHAGSHHHSRHSSSTSKHASQSQSHSQSQQHLFTPGRATSNNGTSNRHGDNTSSHHYSSSSQHHQHQSPRASATSPRRRAHHRRVSSYGMSGIMDRFMESSYSPKAAQIAKFEEAVRRLSPERNGTNERIIRPSSSSSAYDTDRTLIQGRRIHQQDEFDGQYEVVPEDEYLEENDDAEYEDVPPSTTKSSSRHSSVAQSTPKSHVDRSRAVRSAGHEMRGSFEHPSVDARSPRYQNGHPPHQRETPRSARGPSGYNARQELGLASGHGSSSEFGSARKRKASYDLQSPRQLVRTLQASPTPEEGEEDLELDQGRLSPSSYPEYPHSEQKFHSRTAAGHPSSSGLFDGPTPSHSQSSSQSSAASYRLTQSLPRNQRPRQGAPSQLVYQAHPSAQMQASYPQPGPGPVHHHHQHQVQQRMLHGSERAPPGYYQQFPRRTDSDEQLSMYALAPPRSPSQHYTHIPHSQQMSRPHSMSSDYASAQQREIKMSKEQGSANKHSNRERVDSIPSSTASIPMAGPSSSSAVSTLENYVPAEIQVGQYDENTKPPFSYAALIGQAIFSTPNRRMSLADIYTYIMTLYPFYKKQDAGWQNSIRHNLSLNECFVKTQRGPDEPGKGCLWSISPGTEEQFTGGNFYKKGKVPRSASKSLGGGGTSTAPSSNDGNFHRTKANSVASGTETMSAVSAEDSYETQSMNSSSFISSGSNMMQTSTYGHHQQPLHASYGHQGYAAQGHPGVHHQPPPQPHGPSSLRQSKPRPQYSDEFESEAPYEEEDDSFDMDNPPARYARPQPVAEKHGQKVFVGQARATMEQRGSAVVPKRESSPEGEDLSPKHSQIRQQDHHQVHAERSFSNSDNSGSVDSPKRQLPAPLTSPTRRGPAGAEDRHRALLTSPPIMSSPPTNVFARMSQPYQPLRNSFNIPTTNVHAEALMSSPPPSSGIMPSDIRMRRLPPPTPRSTAVDEDSHAGSHIFLPAPNIKPGKPSSGKKDGAGHESKPSLPPIHMMSPASAMTLNTQSPVSSVRGSATQQRSSSPSPKSSSQASTSSTSLTRSPTLSKSRHLSSSEVFKTPERFAAPSSRTMASPSKLAHLTNNNASKALQSLQASTPKLGASRGGHGLVTPGGYYDPYEYGAVLDEELDRMMATSKDGDSLNRHGDRRPLPFPSPLDRTPKWQPWSPW